MCQASFFFIGALQKGIYHTSKQRIIFHSYSQIFIGIFCALEKKIDEIFTNKNIVEITLLLHRNNLLSHKMMNTSLMIS